MPLTVGIMQNRRQSRTRENWVWESGVVDMWAKGSVRRSQFRGQHHRPFRMAFTAKYPPTGWRRSDGPLWISAMQKTIELGSRNTLGSRRSRCTWVPWAQCISAGAYQDIGCRQKRAVVADCRCVSRPENQHISSNSILVPLASLFSLFKITETIPLTKMILLSKKAQGGRESGGA